MARRDPRARSTARTPPSPAGGPAPRGAPAPAASPSPDEPTVQAGEAGLTLAALVRARRGLSWEQAREVVRRGKLSLDGAVATDPAARARAGQALSFDAQARRADRADTQLDASRLVFLDEHLVVVDKPAGVSAVPFDEGERGALADRVQHFLHAKRGAPANAPLFIVHRIDKDTSGLLVFGRTWLAKRHLAGLFRAHAIERRYLALVCGHPARDRFTVDTILVEDRGDGYRGSARPGAPASVGKRAITHIEVLARLAGPLSLVRCQLETGRTHQIRIHLAESGHPLVGERVYGHRIEQPVSAERAMLHAHELGFTHPARPDEALSFRRDPPEDFVALLTGAGGELPR